MKDKKIQYLEQLESCLQRKSIPNVANIVLEYKLHMENKISELLLQGITEDESVQQVLDRMLPPQDVAA